jgi:hypothetical protein
MSRIWQDGFDVYATTADLLFRYNYTTADLNIAGGRWGGGGITLTGKGYLQAPTVTLPDEIWTGFSFTNNTTTVSNSDNVFFSFISASGVECNLSYNPLTLVFKLFQGFSNSVLIGISDPIILTSGTWHFVDIHFKLSTTTTGLCEVWIDNTQVMNLTGIETAWAGGSTITGISIGNASGETFSSNSLPMTFDDWTVNDPNVGTTNIGRIGDSRIVSSVVASDATPNNGTPSVAGPHYAMVDEPQWSSADTITLVNTTGQEEQFTITPITITPVQIFAVQVMAVCEKSDGGAAIAKLGILSSASTAASADLTIPISWGLPTAIFEQDPNGTIAWTKTAVDAIEVNYTVQ